MTDVELELFTDTDAHILIEEGIRGGVAMITRRFAEANNENVESFDLNKDFP